MKKNIYTITIEETVSDVFYLEANSLEEAIEKGKKLLDAASHKK